MTDADKIKVFADQILSDWESAMDRLFDTVAYKAQKANLSPAEVREALYRGGYGEDVADAWADWVGEEL